MSYPDIPRYATSYSCSYSLRVYLFETFFRRRESHRQWCRRNPNKIAERNARYKSRRARELSYDAMREFRAEYEMCSEQLSPLDMLMIKEEALANL